MSKIKGIKIGEGFILSEENEFYKVSSVSNNFSMRVNNTLPFWGACKEAMTNVEFRAIFHDILMFFYVPATININQDVYNKYNAFLGELTKDIKGAQATDKDDEDSLEDVRRKWQMKKEAKEAEEPKGTVYYRPHRVKFEESDALKSVVKSLKDVENYCAKNDFNPTDLRCEYYRQDSDHKIWFDTFVITGDVNGERVSIGFTNGMLK
ncbi:MAG: hypothetical protein RR854_00055 [Muribaculaceae bacterium]